MDSRFEFLYERSRVKRTITSVIVVCVILIGLLLFLNLRPYISGVFEAFPLLGKLYGFIERDILELTPLGIFYLTFLGDLFFNPLPAELIFYSALIKGSNIPLLFVLTVMAAVLANVVNYILGRRFSLFFMSFMSADSVYKIRRKVNRYGGYIVFLFNLLPLPSPVLTFALGITRYNKTRLFSLLFLGTVIKHLAMIAIFVFFAHNNVFIHFFTQ